MANVTWLVNQMPLDSAQVYCAKVEDAGRRGYGYWPHKVYVCPHCGAVWGRELWDHSDGYSRPDLPAWVVLTRACVTHGDGMIGDGIPVTAMPRGLLQYLTQIAFTQLEKLA